MLDYIFVWSLEINIVWEKISAVFIFSWEIFQFKTDEDIY